MGRILAIDYGLKRTGIAVTDILQMTAGTLGTIATTDVLKFIKDYIEKEKVDLLVVGEPKKLNNDEGSIEQHIRGFIKRLNKEIPHLLVNRTDERFTSVMASRAILESGAKKKDRQNKAFTDAVSAVIILQSYLESRNYLSAKQ